MGRRALADEVSTVAVRLPTSMVDLLRARAGDGESLSDVVRRLLAEAVGVLATHDKGRGGATNVAGSPAVHDGRKDVAKSVKEPSVWDDCEHDFRYSTVSSRTICSKCKAVKK